MPAKVFVCSSVLVSTNASALGNIACNIVQIQSNSAASTCLVGDATNQLYALISGATIALYVSNVSSVYVKTAVGSMTINFIAMS